MKYLVVSDMEGISYSSLWSECNPEKENYQEFRMIMTEEVKTICDVLKDGEVIVRDAHHDARNILLTDLGTHVDLIRNFGGQWQSMMFGIKEDIDGVIFHGAHPAGGSGKSPLAHTINPNTLDYIKINDKIVGEVTLNAYIAAYYKVPVFYIEGDKGAVEEAKALMPNIYSTVTKEFDKTVVVSKSLNKVKKEIDETLTKAKIALKENKGQFLITPIENFEAEMRFKVENHRLLNKEGAIKVDDFTIKYQAKDIEDFMKFIR